MILKKWDKLPPEMQNDEVKKYYEILKKNQYGQYLLDVLNGKYLTL